MSAMQFRPDLSVSFTLLFGQSHTGNLFATKAILLLSMTSCDNFAGNCLACMVWGLEQHVTLT